MLFSKVFKAKSKYYDSIDNCPIGLFNKCLVGNDYSVLCIKGKATDKDSAKAWQSIYREYIDMAGGSDKLKDYLDNKTKAGKYFLKSLEEKHYITFYHKYNGIANEIMKEINLKVNYDFSKVLAYTSKFMGFSINPMKTTVREFYGYLNLAQNG